MITHNRHRDGRNEAGRLSGPGVSFYRLDAGGFAAARKVVVTR